MAAETKENMQKWIKKIIGHKYGNRFSWGEAYWGDRDLTLKIYTGEENWWVCISIPFIFRIYIKLFKSNSRSYEAFGFYVYDWREDIVFQFFKQNFRLFFPWHYKWRKTEILNQDFYPLYTSKKGNFDHLTEKAAKDVVSRNFSFTYVLKSGEKQERVATCYIDRMTWGWKWLPFVQKSRIYLNYKFNEEVGEGTGSYKGGVLASGIEMLPGETMEKCLRRLERDVKFGR